MSDDLYYLVRKGTNIRALGEDGMEIMVERDAMQETRIRYEQIMRCQLEPILVDAYYERFEGARRAARRRAKEAVSAGEVESA